MDEGMDKWRKSVHEGDVGSFESTPSQYFFKYSYFVRTESTDISLFCFVRQTCTQGALLSDPDQYIETRGSGRDQGRDSTRPNFQDLQNTFFLSENGQIARSKWTSTA